MSFWDKMESQKDGIEDTVEFTIRIAVVTLACVVLVVVGALVVGLFAPDNVVDSEKVFEIVGPAFNMVIGAFVGLLGGLSLNANARDKETPPEDPVQEPAAPEPDPLPLTPDMVVSQPVETSAVVSHEEPVLEDDDDDDDDDDMSEYEKYRHDLRWDADGDGVVSDNEIPDWVRRP